MKQLFIAGNWKSNKGIDEAEEWLNQFKSLSVPPGGQIKNATIVLCAPFTLLYFLKQKIQELALPLVLGAQDISPFGDGAFTGAISGRQLKEFVDWVIVGHTERRRYFGETDDVLQKKVAQAQEAGLKVIYCVNDETLAIPSGVNVISYEPNWAIGTGHSDNPEHANRIIEVIKKKSSVATVIYGGSVTADNIKSLISQKAIDGVLPGGASLEANIFYNLIAATVSSS